MSTRTFARLAFPMRLILTSSSLGTIIWQIASASFPYNMIGEALPDSNQYTAIQNKLQRGEHPGVLSYANVPRGLLDIIGECWKVNPLLRPTSAEVAMKLQDLLAQEVSLRASNNSNSAEFTEELSSRIVPPPQAVSELLQEALSLIRKARAVNLESPSMIQSSAKLSSAAFEVLIGDDEWTAVKYFVIGAVIFWQLTDADLGSLYSTSNPILSISDNGKLGSKQSSLRALSYA